MPTAKLAKGDYHVKIAGPRSNRGGVRRFRSHLSARGGLGRPVLWQGVLENFLRLRVVILLAAAGRCLPT